MSNPISVDYSTLRSLPELLKVLQENGVSSGEYYIYISQYQEQKAREKGIPLHGMFELTPLCNLDCKMCYVHLNKDQLGNHTILSVDQWKDIIRQAHELGMIHATLTGGECLTYPGFDEIYLYLRELGIQPDLKTNGLLIDNERFDFFQCYQPKSITISLYGSSNEAYKNVTGRMFFDQIYENLLRLKKAKFPVRLAITPSIHMYDDITNIVKLAKDLDFGFSVNIALFPPREETGRSAIDLTIDQYLSMYRMLREGNTDSKLIDEDFEVTGYEKSNARTVGISCAAGRSSFNVNWKGELKGCENLNALQLSVIDHPFSEVWEKIRAEAENYQLPVECNSCAYDPVCFGCVAYRSSGAELGHCNPKICERTKRMANEGFYRL